MKKIDGVALVALGEMAGEVAAAREAAGDSVAEIAAGWLAPQYLVALRGQLRSLADPPERFALLRKVTGDVVALQLANIWAGRLRVEEEKLEFLRQKHQDEREAAKVAAADKAATEKENAKRLDPNRPMTDEELKACVDKVDEIMGLKGV